MKNLENKNVVCDKYCDGCAYYKYIVVPCDIEVFAETEPTRWCAYTYITGEARESSCAECSRKLLGVEADRRNVLY